MKGRFSMIKSNLTKAKVVATGTILGGITYLLPMTSYASESSGASDSAVTALTTACTTMANSVSAALSAVIPIALPIVGVSLVIGVGLKVFKSITRKA